MYKTVQNELQLKQTPTMESCFRINAGGRQSLPMRSHIDRTVTGDTLLHSVRSLFVRLGYFPYYTSILSLGKDFKCKTSCNAVFLMCGISILTDVNVLSTFLQHCKTPIYFSFNLWTNPSRCANSVHCSFTSGVWGGRLHITINTSFSGPQFSSNKGTRNTDHHNPHAPAITEAFITMQLCDTAHYRLLLGSVASFNFDTFCDGSRTMG